MHQTAAQEANLVKSLAEENSTENLEETTLAETAEASYNAVDTTLEDIRKLRVIDKELANANYGTSSDEASPKKDHIDEQEIEEKTVNEIKSKRHSKDDLEKIV